MLKAKIEQLILGVPGYTPLDELQALSEIAEFTSRVEGDILELGTWCGRSAIVLASAVADGVKVYCSDLFPNREDWIRGESGSWSFVATINGEKYPGVTSTISNAIFENEVAPVYAKQECLFDFFKANIQRAGMSERIVAHRGNSDTLLKKYPDLKCRMVFIDAGHEYEAVHADILNADKVLAPGGWICLDDAFTCFPGVDRAIIELLIDNPRYSIGYNIARRMYTAVKK